MEARLINLDDFVLFGGGANGDSYNSRTDTDIMLKLYAPGKQRQSIDELLAARKVYEAGIPSPKPGELVRTADGRFGVLFKRVNGKKSYARAIADNPEKVEQYARQFALMSRKLHATTVNTANFESIKDRYCRLLKENQFFTHAEKRKLSRFIQDAPDTNTALHGDLQFGNLIFVGNTNYFIDLGDFAYGYPLFDLGMVYITCILSDTAFRKENFHMDDDVAAEFWRIFARSYFGEDRPLASIEEEVRPYAGLKTIIIERDTKRPMPEFRAALNSIL